MNKILILCACFLTVVSCKKDTPEDKVSVSEVSGENGVFVGSEGNFQFGNASLAFYDDASSTVSDKVFQSTNNNALGDVLQSMYQLDNTLYLVMNNSSKIEKVDKYTFKNTGTISGFVSPRFFLPVSNSKAYVTDLYSNSIQVVDLNQNTITGSVKTNGWTEELLMLYGKVFVCNKAKNILYVIDSSSDAIIDSVVVGASPSSLQQDKNGMLWVLCEGSLTGGSEEAGLFQVNPVTYVIEKKMLFNVGSQVSNLRINNGNDTLYYLSNGVHKISIDAITLSASAFIPSSDGVNFYGLGINPRNSEVYVSDAVDYLQKSKISKYSSSGVFLNAFTVGVNTSSFSFLR